LPSDPRLFHGGVGPGAAVDRERFTAFSSLAREDDTMDDSALAYAMQALYDSDCRLMRLLRRRRQLALQLARLGHAPAMTVEERAMAVVARLAPHNRGPLDAASLTALFAAVIALTEPHFTGLSTGNGAPKKG
jgi:chorismate mutase